MCMLSLRYRSQVGSNWIREGPALTHHGGCWGRKAEGRVYAKALRWEGTLGIRMIGVWRDAQRTQKPWRGEDIGLDPENKGMLLKDNSDVR